MTDDLDRPPGLPGSGRRRYAAAMALHAAGRLSDAALEVYRICSTRDADDPLALLATGAGGDAEPRPAPDAAAAIAALIAAADHYLAGLEGPGVAEVRMGIAATHGQPVRPRGRPHPVVAEHLAPALAQMAGSHAALAAAIASAAPHLDWGPYEGYPAEAIGPHFPRGHAATTMIGRGAPVDAPDFDLGLFLIAPHVLYRDHCHAAPELYAPLTGPHGWRFAPGAPLMIKPAHQPVWNQPHAPHLTKVGPVPFLCLYAWTRDVSEVARVLPADDWPALEALRLTP